MDDRYEDPAAGDKTEVLKGTLDLPILRTATLDENHGLGVASRELSSRWAAPVGLRTEVACAPTRP